MKMENAIAPSGSQVMKQTMATIRRAARKQQAEDGE
jgi:hypothetical protein